MNKRHIFFYVGLVILASVALVGAPLTAAAHPNVTVRSSLGAAITDGTTPYSPKNTCGGCHFDCTLNSYSTNTFNWCQNDSTQKNCTVAGNCPDYESMETKIITKVQGYITSSGTISNMTYTVKVPLHGASTGKHSTEGRNEAMTLAQRSIWAAPATVSAPGMWGRY